MQLNNLDLTDSEIDDIVKSVNDLDDIIDAYDTSELMLVPEEIDESSIELNEVLSRAGRIKARAKLRRQSIKLQRSKKIALKKKSNNAVLIKRARKLAIKMMKEKLAKKKLGSMSVADKMRIERIVAKRGATIDKIAKRLMPKIRKIEQARLTHKRFTK